MGYDAVGRIYIPAEEWYAFLTKFLPKLDGETAFGRPVVGPDGEIVVEYATSTEAHPADWQVKPSFLQKP